MSANLEFNNEILNTSGYNDDDDDILEDNYEIAKKQSKKRFLLNSVYSVKSNSSKDNIIQKGTNNNTNNPIVNTNNNLLIKDDMPEDKLEELYTNLYTIPMNRPSKFSKSKMGFTFLYESNSKTTHYQRDSVKFAISKNTEIITYLLGLFIFSEFANLDDLEKDKRFKILFIKKK